MGRWYRGGARSGGVVHAAELRDVARSWRGEIRCVVEGVVGWIYAQALLAGGACALRRAGEIEAYGSPGASGVYLGLRLLGERPWAR